MLVFVVAFFVPMTRSPLSDTGLPSTGASVRRSDPPASPQVPGAGGGRRAALPMGGAAHGAVGRGEGGPGPRGQACMERRPDSGRRAEGVVSPPRPSDFSHMAQRGRGRHCEGSELSQASQIPTYPPSYVLAYLATSLPEPCLSTPACRWSRSLAGSAAAPSTTPPTPSAQTHPTHRTDPGNPMGPHGFLRTISSPRTER